MENEGAREANLIQPRQWLLLLALLAGNVALALGPWLVRLADTGPVSAGFWRLFLALPFLAVFARFSGQALTGIPRRTLMFVALGAVAFGLDLASWHVGIEMTRLGNATLFRQCRKYRVVILGLYPFAQPAARHGMDRDRVCACRRGNSDGA